MSKKILASLMVSCLVAGIAFAGPFAEGMTSVGGSYIYRDGEHFGGLSSQTFGFFDSSVGYFVGANAGFNLSEGTNWNMNIIAAPSYRYHFAETDMNVDLAVGLSFSGTWAERNEFGFGVGGYLGAAWDVSSDISILLGCSLGYDMLKVDLDTSAVDFGGRFYTIPSLSIGFKY